MRAPLDSPGIAKADRYLKTLKDSKQYLRFRKLAEQACDHNDFRVCEMVYTWAEFECRRGDDDGV